MHATGMSLQEGASHKSVPVATYLIKEIQAGLEALALEALLAELKPQVITLARFHIVHAKALRPSKI